MYVLYEGERLYLSAWEYNAARVLTELARIVKNNGGTVAPQTAAGCIFDMLTSAPVSKIRLDTKRRRVPNLYDGGYHYETVAAQERFTKIDFLEGC